MSTAHTASDIVERTAETIDNEADGSITRDEALAILHELDTAALDYAD